MFKLLYQQDDFPVFQNRMYESKEEAINCPKGVIFALLKVRSGQPVNRVIDINPAKQGQFHAGTGLKVCAWSFEYTNRRDYLYYEFKSSRRNKANVK
jgi:hypothetical protein